MSFLEGFANAVSKNVTDDRKRRKDMEDDVFATNYKVYLSRQEERRKESQKDRDLYGMATVAAERQGLNDKDGRNMAFQFFKGGGTLAEWNKMHEEGSFVKNQNGTPPAPRAPGEDISTEMKTSGLAPDPVTTQSTQPQTPVDIEAGEDGYVPRLETGRSSIAVNNMPQEQVRATASQEKFVKDISKRTGEDEDKVRETMYGKTQQDLSPFLTYTFKPNSNQQLKLLQTLPNDPKQLRIIEAKYRTSGMNKEAEWVRNVILDSVPDNNIPDGEGWLVKTDKDGKTLRVKGKVEEGKFFESISDGSGEKKFAQNGKPLGMTEAQFIAGNSQLEFKDHKIIIDLVQPFSNQKRNIQKTINSTSRAIGIVRENPLAVTETAQYMTKMQGWTQEIAAIQQSITDIMGRGGDAKALRQQTDAIAATSQKWTKAIDESNISPGAKELAKIKMDLAYSKLKSYGETGSGITNRDIDNQMALVFDNNPANFETYLLKSLKADVDDLENQRVNLMETSQSVILQNPAMGWMDDTVQTQLDKSSTPEVKDLLHKMGAMTPSVYQPAPVRPQGQPQPTAQPQAQPQAQSKMSEPVTKEQYDALKPGQEYIAPDGKKRIKK